MVWYGTEWCGMVQHGVVCGMVQHGIVWYSMVWYGTAWSGMVQHGTAWCGMWYGTAWCGIVQHGVVTIARNGRDPGQGSMGWHARKRSGWLVMETAS